MVRQFMTADCVQVVKKFSVLCPLSLLGLLDLIRSSGPAGLAGPTVINCLAGIAVTAESVGPAATALPALSTLPTVSSKPAVITAKPVGPIEFTFPAGHTKSIRLAGSSLPVGPS